MAEEKRKMPKLRAIKLKIQANSKIAKDLEVKYKGEKIEGAITTIELYLVSSNSKKVIKDLVKNTAVLNHWASFDYTELYEFLDWSLKGFERLKKEEEKCQKRKKKSQ